MLRLSVCIRLIARRITAAAAAAAAALHRALLSINRAHILSGRLRIYETSLSFNQRRGSSDIRQKKSFRRWILRSDRARENETLLRDAGWARSADPRMYCQTDRHDAGATIAVDSYPIPRRTSPCVGLTICGLGCVLDPNSELCKSMH